MLNNKEPTKDVSKDDIKNKIPQITSSLNRVIKISKNISFGKKNIPIIAGPNGVESEKLMHKVAKNLVKNKVQIIRGHSYKPLTFPYRSKQYFETQDKGMDIMDSIKKSYGLKVVTEVTEIRYLERINKTADILQIGSRNMQNFELLREIAKCNKPIILKRHFGSSLRDFLGAAEHLIVFGNKKIILCERGVSIPHTHKETSRFALDLQIVPAIKEICKYPVIVDPSHACFWAKWVPSLTLASVASGCDGLIIEMHPNPKKSAVDPLQPLNFKEFNSLRLKLKKIAKSINRNIF